MKSASNLLEQLNALPFFGKNTVLQLGRQLGLTPATITTYISRFIKSREIIPLKNSLYIADEYYTAHRQDASYLYYLANILRRPSYVSSWTALQYYGLATEAIKVIASVTPKVGRSYQTKAGVFSFQSIQKPLFTDFILIKGKYNYFIANPTKAVFDTLYYKTHQFRGLRFVHIRPLLEELRIDIDEMKPADKRQLYAMVKKYLHE